MIIGEAISKIDMRTLLKYNNDKKYWLNIKGTRNFLIHEYHGVDYKLLYKIATTLCFATFFSSTVAPLKSTTIFS